MIFGVKEKLKELKKVYIDLDEIESILNVDTYSKLVVAVRELIDENVICPIKVKNNTNGKIPPLYVKYRIVKDEEDIKEFKSEIKMLFPAFKIDKYLNNLDKYKEHRDVILPLDHFLKENNERLKVKLSKNERAYQIWGYEKMLDSSLTKSVISYNELQERLNFYLTPEPFFDFIPKKKESMTILIIENKDSWYTLRKIMTEENKTSIKLFRVDIDGLVYGEGNKITKENALTYYQKNVLMAKCNFIYWGDIDFSGIDLYQRVCAANKDIKINLFSEIYERMVSLTAGKMLHEISKNQNKVNCDEFFLGIKSFECRDKIKLMLDKNQYIPQEIMNYEELKCLIV